MLRVAGSCGIVSEQGGGWVYGNTLLNMVIVWYFCVHIRPGVISGTIQGVAVGLANIVSVVCAYPKDLLQLEECTGVLNVTLLLILTTPLTPSML